MRLYQVLAPNGSAKPEGVLVGGAQPDTLRVWMDRWGPKDDARSPSLIAQLRFKPLPLRQLPWVFAEGG